MRFMTGTCRLVLVIVFAVFWGGLTFYTGIAVRVAHDVLIDPMDGGLITQRVTRWLQGLGAAAALLMWCNAVIVRRSARSRGNALLGCTLLLAAALGGLVVVHRQMDSVIDVAERTISDRDAFVVGHRRYNQLTTIVWLSSLAYMGIAVSAWQHVDRLCGGDNVPAGRQDSPEPHSG